MSPLSPLEVKNFQARIYRYYRRHKRVLPWRQTRDPYRILVSEIMLQQTPVPRVIGKYEEFLARFPDFPALAAAPWPEVLAVWQGLGYNRRALALKRLSQEVMARWQGHLPATRKELRSLPGVGPATAGAVLAFAFEQRVIFVETNIRRVFLHFFFSGREGVRDREILPLVEQTLDAANIREWYYALMDFGAMLKAARPNPNRRSAHYVRQAPFQGSRRQLRGRILKILLNRPSASLQELIRELSWSPEQVTGILEDLAAEGLISRRGSKFFLPRGP